LSLPTSSYLNPDPRNLFFIVWCVYCCSYFDPVFLKLFESRHTKSKFWQFQKKIDSLEMGNFDSLERKILTVWKRKILTVLKGKFDSFENQNFYSLKRKILTVWKEKFWQFGWKFWQFEKDNFDSFRDTVKFIGVATHSLGITVSIPRSIWPFVYPTKSS
jgi:hypothetical protein